ncbi:enoyl-ACP reductase FabI [Vallitalea okinawensis]|uniref:enoyl-ACP reductase FabI n=1 Tax=Vallitalea okinawensis TaxID=2078660 RepID=UPI000CFAA0B8|nr:enoyl-ACP reductase FabI [Vallitalea okinawensis]
MDLLKDKKIVIMGVSNKWSIAWGCAQVMKSYGAQIIYTYQNERIKDKLQKMIGEEGILIPCDVTKDEEIEAAFNHIKDEVGTIDGVIHSIAYAKQEDLYTSVVNTSREGYALAQDISAYSLIAVTRCASELMTNGGSIVTMSYIGSQKAVTNYNVMGMAKAALESSVRYLASDLGSKDIRVNAISAGPIKTAAAKGIKDFSTLIKSATEKTPLRRTVTKEEVGNVAAFLSSELSSGITGEIIYVDGGLNIVL